MIKPMSQREIDMRAERELAKFLDEHLYQKLLNEGKFTSFERVTDIRRQMQGIDIIGKTADKCYKIDEKAQLHYLNDTRPTFAFELEFIRYGQAIEWWFLKNYLETTHYLLLWPNAKTKDLSRIDSGDFTNIEGMMISKRKLKKHLEGIGLSDKLLKAETQRLRACGASEAQEPFCKGIKFYVSPAYIENPVNLIVNKRILAKVADAHYMISQQGFFRI